MRGKLRLPPAGRETRGGASGGSGALCAGQAVPPSAFGCLFLPHAELCGDTDLIWSSHPVGGGWGLLGLFLAAPCWEAKGGAAAINLFQNVPVCTRQGRGPGVGSAAGLGGLALGRWGPPPCWARHLGPFLPTNSPPCPRCYRNNSMDVGNQQGSRVTLPLAQPPLGRASAQCPFLARLLMLLNDGRGRSCGSSGLQSLAIWRKGRANTPPPPASQDRAGIMPSGGD